MYEEFLNGQESYEPYENYEDILEEDIYEDDLYGEDILEDYYSDYPEMAERVYYTRPRSLRRLRNREKRRKNRPVYDRSRRSKSYGFGNHPRRSRGIQIDRPTNNYFIPKVPNQAATVKNVDKAFKVTQKEVEKVKAATQKVDIDNKVREDKIRSALKAQGKRISGNEYAMTVSTIVDKLKEEFPEFSENQIVKTALSILPSLFYKPAKTEFYKDARFITPVVTSAIAIFKEWQNKNKADKGVQNVTITPPVKTIAVGDNGFSFSAAARDGKGEKIEGKSFTWYSINEAIATIDNSGKVVGIGAGTTEIYVQEDSTGRSASVDIIVIAPPKNLALIKI